MRYRTSRVKSLEKAEFCGQGQSFYASVEQFQQVFFFQKNRNFCDITQFDFQSNLKIENTAKVKLEKLYFPHDFPILILRQFFLYVSVHVMSLHSLASNASQSMSAYVSAAKRYYEKFNISYLDAKSNQVIPAGPYQGGKHW